MNDTLRIAILGAILSMGSGVAIPQTAAAQEAALSYQIKAGDLDGALKQFASQSRMQLIYSAEVVEGKVSAGLTGSYTPSEALGRLLEGKGVAWDAVNGTTFVLKAAEAPATPTKPAPARAEPAAVEEDVKNMPAIMVTGTRTLNMDIMRTEDDPQPYVVFDREQIERSGATSLEQFLQQRLTMNTSPNNSGRGSTNTGVATSQITLRGLSAAQTLILIDGHRVSSPSLSSGSTSNNFGTLGQVDVSGIPLNAIDRIEILPTTASGIYGGSATGGVINIIMRRDYTGAEIRYIYENTFNTDTAAENVSLMFGKAFNDGATNILATANYSDANDLLTGDRNLLKRGRETILTNSPESYLPPSFSLPLGQTPNIGSVDGSNLILDDGTSLNSSFTSVPMGYLGPGSDGGAALAANAGTYNWNLADTAQIDGKRQALYTKPLIKSGSLVVRHENNHGVQLFTDLSYSESSNSFPASSIVGSYVIPSGSPTNPFTQDIRVSVPMNGGDANQTTTVKHHRALVGVLKELPKKWHLGVDFIWDRTRASYATGPAEQQSFRNAVAAGQIDLLRDTNKFPIDIEKFLNQSVRTSSFDSTMTEWNARASGSVGELPAGTMTLSTLVAYRKESVPDAVSAFPVGGLAQYYPNRSQTVESSYLELRVPVFSAKNDRALLRELELQLAVRRDSYSGESGAQQTIPYPILAPLPDSDRSQTSFSSTDPTVAIKWRPWRSLAIRASYGTGFLPPGLDQLVPMVFPFPVSFSFITDPLRGNTQAGPFTLVQGGNPDLKPEESTSVSAGLVFAPETVPGLRLSADYTQIVKRDNIVLSYPGLYQGLINDESLFPNRVVRGDTLPTDPPDWAGPIALLDMTAMNLAETKLEAWDVQVDYRKETSGGSLFDFFIMGTWQPSYKTKISNDVPFKEAVGVSYLNPLRFKSNAGLSWSYGPWQAGWNISHFDSYKVSDIQTYIVRQGGSGRVPSQTYHDAFVKYTADLGNSHQWRLLENTNLQLGVRNIFNKKPPLDVLSAGLYSPFGDPRLSSWYFSITVRM